MSSSFPKIGRETGLLMLNYYFLAGTRSSRLGMTPGSATSGSQTIPEEDEFDKLVDLVRLLSV